MMFFIHRRLGPGFAGLLAAAMAAMPGAAAGQTHSWKAVPADQNWFNGANWDGDGSYPGAGAEVAVGAGAVIALTNETAALTSFTMAGGTLMFSNWPTRLQATTVLLNGGTLTLAPAFTNGAMSNRVWIVCQDFTLGAAAQINADGKGYLGSHGPGGASTAARYGGGGHGGRGGRGDIGGGGAVYGAIHAPIYPGSGGAYGAVNGGAGGGAVRIEASGSVTLDGVITANGLIGNHSQAGGGSGGSIYIACDVFGAGASSWLIANGGNGGSASYGGGGGGGRLAVSYASVSGTPAVRFSAAPGVGAGDYYINTSGWIYGTGWGTLSLPDAALLAEPLASGQFTKLLLYFRDISTWSPAGLTVADNTVVLATPGLKLSVAGGLTVGANAELGVGELFGDSNTVVTVGNNLVVTNGGVFSVYSGLAMPALGDFGARIVASNSLVVADSSWIHPYSHYTNGGSAQFVAGSLSVATGGGFNAHAKGYAGLQGPAKGVDGGSRGSGGGHGGRGGYTDTGLPGGGPVGSVDRPMRPGSGAGSSLGYGGGLIVVTAATASISGTLNASGGSAGGLGGGAGGGILVDCASLSGQSPLLVADGGNGLVGLGGGGGGGRIALHYGDISGLTSPRFRVRRGNGNHNLVEYTSWQYGSHRGSAWFSTPDLLSETLDGDRFEDVCFYAAGFTSWDTPSLTVSNCAFTFGEDGFALNVTGNLRIETNGMLGLGALSGNGRPSLDCGGDLIVAGGGELHVYSGRTNGPEAGLGATVDVAGDLILEAGGWVFPYSHDRTDGGGGSPRFRAQSLTVAAQAGFKAIGRGYQAGQGPKPGLAAGSGRGGGGGYGGTGGTHSASGTAGGGTNGLAQAPTLPGSGGGNFGGSGGGVIWLEIEETADVDGLLNADGANGIGNGGGGAGGSVLVSARDIRATASASFHANGGSGTLAHGGGGGGGRLAFWRYVNTAKRLALSVGLTPEKLMIGSVPFAAFEGAHAAVGGSGFSGGGVGSVRFVDGTPSGTVITVH